MVAGNICVELNLAVGKSNCYSNVANFNNITYSELLPNIITAKISGHCGTYLKQFILFLIILLFTIHLSDYV